MLFVFFLSYGRVFLHYFAIQSPTLYSSLQAFVVLVWWKFRRGLPYFVVGGDPSEYFPQRESLQSEVVIGI